nr:hypothetical protein [Tanacetum cinerariifolium]
MVVDSTTAAEAAATAETAAAEAAATAETAAEAAEAEVEVAEVATVESEAVIEATEKVEEEAVEAAEKVAKLEVGIGARIGAGLGGKIETGLRGALNLLTRLTAKSGNLLLLYVAVEQIPTAYRKIVAGWAMNLAAGGIKLTLVAYNYMGLSGSQEGKK